jgi:hypothetical protein
LRVGALQQSNSIPVIIPVILDSQGQALIPDLELPPDYSAISYFLSEALNLKNCFYRQPDKASRHNSF